MDVKHKPWGHCPTTLAHCWPPCVLPTTALSEHASQSRRPFHSHSRTLTMHVRLDGRPEYLPFHSLTSTHHRSGSARCTSRCAAGITIHQSSSSTGKASRANRADNDNDNDDKDGKDGEFTADEQRQRAPRCSDECSARRRRRWIGKCSILVVVSSCAACGEAFWENVC
jgi:hypothetical protein